MYTLDALTGAMLDLPKEHHKCKNERHAAWERMFVKQSTVKHPKRPPLNMLKSIKNKLF